jgi:hypothetical protein
LEIGFHPVKNEILKKIKNNFISLREKLFHPVKIKIRKKKNYHFVWGSLKRKTVPPSENQNLKKIKLVFISLGDSLKRKTLPLSGNPKKNLNFRVLIT